MTIIAKLDLTQSVADLGIMTAYARKTALTGEEPRVRSLWDNHYRINYFLHAENRIGRSLFVTVKDGKIEMPAVQ